MDLNYIPLKMTCECCGEDMGIRSDKRFCSNKCRQKWNYHNNTDLRDKQIKRSRERVEEERRMNKLKKEKKRVNDLIEQTKIKIDDNIIELYKKIYGK